MNMWAVDGRVWLTAGVSGRSGLSSSCSSCRCLWAAHTSSSPGHSDLYPTWPCLHTWSYLKRSGSVGTEEQRLVTAPSSSSSSSWRSLTFHCTEHFLENSEKLTGTSGLLRLCSSRYVCTKYAYAEVFPLGLFTSPLTMLISWQKHHTHSSLCVYIYIEREKRIQITFKCVCVYLNTYTNTFLNLHLNIYLYMQTHMFI